LEISFLFKGLVQWQLLERTRQVVILNPNVYNILIARHVTVTLFLLFLFVGSAGLARLRRETCAIDAGRFKQQQKPPKRPTGGCCTV
jgi:hypothetical protein